MGNLKAEIVCKEHFPCADFIMERIDPETVGKLLTYLRKDYTIHERKVIFNDKENVEDALILSKSNYLLGVLNINHNSSLFDDKFVKLSLLYAPSKKGLKLLKKIKSYLKKQIISSHHIRLEVFLRWEKQIYFITPEEFLNPLIPELFQGIDTQKLTESYLNSSQSILILFGNPGTGKSKLIQYIVGKSPQILQKTARVLVIKGKENIIRSADNFNTYLENDIVVLDDFDFVSFTRNEDNDIANVISTILSVTDGFIPKRPKIIISTNKKFSEIDPALLRPSRLFDILELKAISRSHFKKICKSYPKLLPGLELFKKKENVKIAEIFDYITRIKQADNYLIDKEVSKKEGQYSKKLGF